MVVQLSILVGNVDDLLARSYSRIEVWASTNEGGFYEEITASVATPATLDSAKPNTTFSLGGRLLRLSLNGQAEVSIDFSTVVQHWTATQVASRINEVVPGLASVVDERVRLTSSITGRLSSIAVTYCDAPDLGWVGIAPVLGKAARPALVAATYFYAFNDDAGRGSYRYKWRFSADGVTPISDFSKAVDGSTPPAVGTDKLSVAVARFIGADGVPQPTKLIVAAVSDPMSLSGFLVTGWTRVIETDESGFIQFALVRGLKVRVAIEGTKFVREFTVPDAATFDILQAMSDSPDSFTIQTTPALVTRRSF